MLRGRGFARLASSVVLPRNATKADVTAAVAACPPAVFGGKIEVTADLERANEIVADARWLDGETMLGFDSESALSWRKGSGAQPTTVLQLACERRALVFSIARPAAREAFASPVRTNLVRDVLEAHDVALVCQGAAGDAGPLHSEFGIHAASLVDLVELSAAAGLKPRTLRAAVAHTLGLRLSKREQMSNWRRFPLTPSQVEYAATDAWAPLAVFRALTAAHPHLAADVAAQLAAGGPPPGAPRFVVSTARMLATPLPEWLGTDAGLYGSRTPFSNAWQATHPAVTLNNLASYYRASVSRTASSLTLTAGAASWSAAVAPSATRNGRKRNAAVAALALVRTLLADPAAPQALVDHRIAHL